MNRDGRGANVARDEEVRTVGPCGASCPLRANSGLYSSSRAVAFVWDRASSGSASNVMPLPTTLLLVSNG